MARTRRRRDAHGRFVKRNAAPRRRRLAVMANPRRRTRRTRRAAPRRNAYFMNPRRRRASRRTYRRNPPMFGRGQVLGMNLKDVGFAGIGFLAPPMVEGFAKSFLPTALTDNKIGKYAVKIGIVAGLSYAASKFVSREAGKYIGIGGAVYVLANMVVEFVPALFSGGFSGYMNPGQAYRTLPGAMRSQPYLGMYQGSPGSMRQNSLLNVPSRLDPAGRL